MNKDTDSAPWSYEPRTQTILDKNGDYIAMIRGWGHLTGKGHMALGLSEEEAIKIQDDRGCRLAKVPEYEVEIARLRDAVNSLDGKLGKVMSFAREGSANALQVEVETLRETINQSLNNGGSDE